METSLFLALAVTVIFFALIVVYFVLKGLYEVFHYWISSLLVNPLMGFLENLKGNKKSVEQKKTTSVDGLLERMMRSEGEIPYITVINDDGEMEYTDEYLREMRVRRAVLEKRARRIVEIMDLPNFTDELSNNLSICEAGKIAVISERIQSRFTDDDERKKIYEYLKEIKNTSDLKSLNEDMYYVWELCRIFYPKVIVPHREKS